MTGSSTGRPCSAPIRHQRQQEDARDAEGHDGDDDGQEIGGERRRADHRLGVRHDGEAGHRGVVHARNREAERRGGEDERRPAAAAAGKEQRQARRRDGDRHARRDEGRRVRHVGAGMQRAHAE